MTVTNNDQAKAIAEAINIAVRYGGFDGEQHKTWVIDQMVRALSGEQYERIVNHATGDDPTLWDVGTAP